MRLTVVVSEFPALSETFVLDQVVSLLGHGHDVRIVAERSRTDAVTHDAVRCHDLLSRTRFFLPDRSRAGRIRRGLGALHRAGPVRLARMVRAFRQARATQGEPGSLDAILGLVATLGASPQPDAIICHFGPNGAMTARALDALGWRTPFATILHGYEMSLLVEARGPALYRHLFARGDLILPVCDAFARRAVEMGCDPGKIAVQRMCVDPATLDAACAALGHAAPPAAPFTFLAVGRMVEKKGRAFTLRAFAQACRDLPDGAARLLIAGNGPLRAELEALTAELGLGDAVRFLGPMVQAEVLAAMLRAHCLVQASVTASDGDTEGMPVVIAEAMTLSRPVLSTRHSGIPEVVVDGETGLLVAEHDKAGLAAAMRRLVADPEAAAEMGRRGRARVETLFDAGQWNRRLEDRMARLAKRP